MSYKFDSIVNRSEAENLKNMIFNRAKERSQGFQDDMKNDVMDIARESFVSKGNPFSKIIDNKSSVKASENTNNVESVVSESEPESNEINKENIGFPVRNISLKFKEQSRLIQEQSNLANIQSTMRDAREGLNKKTSFMGALNFLNSQAAVSLIRTRADKFEMVI